MDIEILETNLIITQIMEKLGLSLIYGCLQNSKSHKIVGVQIKLVHEIETVSTKLLWLFKVCWCLFVCICIRKLWISHCGWVLNMRVPKTF